MRLGVISDMHGNLIALDAVLDDLARAGVDRVVCLGDVASLGPQPEPVLARIRELGCSVVLGNTDAWLLDPPAVTPQHNVHERAVRLINAWCAARLSDDERSYIRTFSPRIDITLSEDLTLRCVHGSPCSFDDRILSDTPLEELDAMLGEVEEQVVIGGHTHIQMVRRHRDTVVINPGSVGLPPIPPPRFGQNAPGAEYGIISADGGSFSVELRHIPMDLDEMMRPAIDLRMPELEWWRAQWHRVSAGES